MAQITYVCGCLATVAKGYFDLIFNFSHSNQTLTFVTKVLICNSMGSSEIWHKYHLLSSVGTHFQLQHSWYLSQISLVIAHVIIAHAITSTNPVCCYIIAAEYASACIIWIMLCDCMTVYSCITLSPIVAPWHLIYLTLIHLYPGCKPMKEIIICCILAHIENIQLYTLSY